MLNRFIDLYKHAKNSVERSTLIELAKKYLRVNEYNEFCKLTGAK